MLSRVLGGIRAAERVVLVALMLAMSGLYGFNVAIRNLASHYAATFAWIDEATRFMMVWVVFLCLGLALERGRQIAMTTVFTRIRERSRIWLQRLINLAGFVFALWLARLGYHYTVFIADTGQTSPTLEVPIAMVYVVIPLGFGLLALRYLLDLFGITARFAAAARHEGHGA
ncbi:MAG: TRAP transporter small permease subunit [Alphaproteobacteria bacterium]|nr:TRAP transporter small permease subunit [Alphaproteobacteria bacterium]